jgi:hypothetical protein
MVSVMVSFLVDWRRQSAILFAEFQVANEAITMFEAHALRMQ